MMAPGDQGTCQPQRKPASVQAVLAPHRLGLVKDHRGATALFFAVIVTAMLGFIGLATEVGAWYLARIEAYNAADAAASAAALALALHPADAGAAVSAATDIVQKNGFAVPVGSPPVSPPVAGQYAGNAAAAEVWVSVNFTPVLASLFTNRSTLTITAHAVGLLGSPGYACALAISGGLQIAQAQYGNGSVPCYYASNGTAAGQVGLTFTDGAAISAAGISTLKDCANCPLVPALTGGMDLSGQTYLARPNSAYQPPTTNPYTVIYNPATGTGLDVAVSRIICPVSGITYPPEPHWIQARTVPLAPDRWPWSRVHLCRRRGMPA
jgi:Flp pilus assembly protein TadG